jgi:hypothetical protein
MQMPSTILKTSKNSFDRVWRAICKNSNHITTDGILSYSVQFKVYASWITGALGIIRSGDLGGQNSFGIILSPKNFFGVSTDIFSV